MAAWLDGASIDVIARTAGVSKAMLYSYFPDQRLLFSEKNRVVNGAVEMFLARYRA